jgi:asparaginyl-tRNA synthetase
MSTDNTPSPDTAGQGSPAPGSIERGSIAEIGRFVDREVEIAGWLYNLRSKGKIHFLQLRDGTGRIQAVAVQGECDPASITLIDSLKMEASLLVRGRVRRDERAPSGYELAVSSLQVVQNPAEDFPIAKKEHGIDFLMENRHLWLRSTLPGAMLRVRHEAIASLRRFFNDRGFILIDTPILTGAVGESSSSLFSVEYFDLGTAHLAQTGQLYLEAACMAFGKVYNFGPTFRAEKSKTRRHLTEFWMLEAEVAYLDNRGNLELQEQMISALVSDVLSKCGKELETLGRDTAPLRKIAPPFPRLDYGEAVERLSKLGHTIEWGSDLGAEEETVLAGFYDRPLFVTNYPKKAKAFYMKENPDNPATVLCADLLAPEGYGEIIGGSQREDDHDKLLSRIREEKLPEESYGWYLDLRRYGSVPHSGFGLGLERTVTWLCGTHHIREAIPFPRTISRIYP